MARGGINKATVEMACREIRSEGHLPTIERIRKKIGGSDTTISRYLREIRDGEPEMFGPAGRIHTELATLVGQLHDKLREMSEAEVTKAQEVAQASIELIRRQSLAELEEERTAHAECKRDLEEKHSRLVTVEALNAELSTKFHAANCELAAQAAELKNATDLQAKYEARVTHLELDVQAGVDALRHFQEASQKLRKSENDSYEATIASLRNQLQTANTLNAEQSGRMNQLNRDNARLESTAQVSGRSLEERNVVIQDLKQELKNALELVESLKISCATAGGQVSLLTQQLTEAVASKANAEETVRQQAGEIGRLNQEVALLILDSETTLNRPQKGQRGDDVVT